MGDPQNGWFIRENPTKMDDDWGYPYDWGNQHFSNEKLRFFLGIPVFGAGPCWATHSARDVGCQGVFFGGFLGDWWRAIGDYCEIWGFPESWGIPNSWMVFVRETPNRSKWMMTSATLMLGNPHMDGYVCSSPEDMFDMIGLSVLASKDILYIRKEW